MANQVEHTIEQNNASIKGLTSEEVRAAQAAGKVNADATVKRARTAVSSVAISARSSILST